MDKLYVSYDLDCISIEKAKSNRSECKECREKINKGEVRISYTVYFDPEHFQRNPHWHHVKCFKIPQKFKDIKVYEFEQGDDISDSDRKELAKQYKIEIGDDSMIPNNAPKYRRKRAIVEYEDQKFFTRDEFKKFKQYKEELNKFTNKDLLAQLQKNSQLVSASTSKEKLIERVAESKVLGSRYPYCKNCGNTNYQLDYHKGLYKCSGYLDDIDWQKCGIYFKSVPRTEWVE